MPVLLSACNQPWEICQILDPASRILKANNKNTSIVPRDTSIEHAHPPDEAALSPHLRQHRRGYRWLRFERALEEDFRNWYWQLNAQRARFSLLAGALMFGLFALRDAMFAPAEVADWTVRIRLYVIVTSIIGAYLVVRFVDSQRLREAALLGASIASLAGMGIANVGALLLGGALPYEGMILIIFFLYFLLGMRTWRTFWVCLLVCVFVQVSWRLTELGPNDIQLRGYYLFSAVAIGGIGSYALEYQARGHFLTLRIAQFRGNTDVLTGRPSRRAILEHLSRALRLAAREQTPVGLFLIDVDYFKKYNDTYSHIEGDRCLRAVANACAGVLRRPLDAVGRFGGEEFLAVAPGATPAHVAALGQRLCAAVSDLDIAHEHGVNGKVSISVGGYSVPTAQAGDSTTTLLRRADEALYAAKHAGRNQFCDAGTTQDAR